MTPSSSIVLVVAHGSRSKRWAAAVRDWFAGFARRLGPEQETRLAFLEITEPLLEDVLPELTGEREVVIFPFFLSRSGHVGEDIPAAARRVLGGSTPWRMIPPSGWDQQLGRNAEERLRRAGADPRLPVIVCGYGTSGDDAEWLALVARIRDHAGVYAHSRWWWAPCGHFLADPGEPLRSSLRQAMGSAHAGAAILPLFLSVSSYQEELIPSVAGEFPGLSIASGADAVLPDPAIEEWAAQFVREQLEAPSHHHSSRMN